MHSRRTFVVRAGSAAAALVVVGCGKQSTSSGSSKTHVVQATAVTQVFGDGQKLTAVAVTYDAAIASSKLSTSDFRVKGRTVTRVYANTTPAPTETGVDGPYVIIELDPNDSGAALTENAAKQLNSGGPAGAPLGSGSGKSGPPTGTTAQQGGPPSGTAGKTGGPPAGGPGGQMSQKAKKATATIAQTGTVVTAAGASYPATTTRVKTSAVKNLVVDDFEQLSFKDPKTGLTIKYNLFTPKNYDASKSYPLVLFIHDASVLSTITTTTLTQGNGATVWASPADQAKRPAFVLAPQFAADSGGTGSGGTSAKQVDATVNLVKNVVGRYGIDEKRLYTTGQSMGAIMSLAMDIEHPDLFAASYIVAGQYDASKVGPIVNDKLWILVSQGDQEAYPGENEITAALEKKGAKVTRAVWNGRSTAKQFAKDVRKVVAKDASINYTPLKKGTVVPKGLTDNALNNHLSTWTIAYDIEGIREWIFEQKR